MWYWRVWVLFSRVILQYLLGINKKSKYYLAGKNLFGLSFRYKNKDKNSFSFFLNSYFKTLLTGKPVNKSSYTIYQPGGAFFYEGNSTPVNEREWVEHIAYFDKKSPDGVIWKDRLLYCTSLGNKALLFFFETLLFVLLLPVSLFNSLKGSLGLIFYEYIELVNLMTLVEKLNVKEIYYCSIYEKDSNVSSILLQKHNVKVYKIQSLTPLKFWNSIIVATDRLILSDTSQLDELDTFKDSIDVNKVEVWGPYNIIRVAKHYKVNKYATTESVIGFYSTASYIRALSGHIEQKGLLKNEDTVKSYLAEYLKERPDAKLIIFTHPKEKLTEHATLVQQHYSSFFSGTNYSIADWPDQSIYHFEKVNVGVAMYSSVIFERLYFGFKSVMMPFDNDGIMTPGRAISNICAVNKADLFSKIDAFLKQTPAEYFKYTGLKKSPFLIENGI